MKEYIPLDDSIEIVTKISYNDIAGTIQLSVHSFVHLSINPSICLAVYPPIHPLLGLLAAGTNSGHTLIWRRMDVSSDSTNQWQFITSSTCDGHVFDLSVNPYR